MHVHFPRVPFTLPQTKTVQVGSRFTPSSLKEDVSKRLRTIAESTEAPLSAAEGILAGLNKHGSMLASVANRHGIEDIVTTIAPLTASVEMAKKMVRCECTGMCVFPTHQPKAEMLCVTRACL